LVTSFPFLFHSFFFFSFFPMSPLPLYLLWF
jgi:hypothetical protein